MAKRLLIGLCALALALAACGDDSGSNNGGGNNGGGNNGGGNNGESVEPFSEDCTAMITPTPVPAPEEGSLDAAAEENRAAITAALVEPSDGDVICLGNGVYVLQSQLTLNASDVSNIEIRGESQDGVVLDFAGQTEGSNGILVDGIDDFRAASFTIKNTAGDGIKVQNGDGVELVDLTVTWDAGPSTSNGAYGVYPVLDQNVLVDNVTVSYASDAGIYVGQSNNVIVRNSTAFGNVAGLEIENTSNAEVHDNHLYENTGGLLVFNLPDLQVRDGSHNKIHNNLIENNNQGNFAEPGTIVSLVPAGVGLLLLSTDNNEIHDNEIKDNDSVGVGIISYLLTGEEITDEEYDAYSEGNYVHTNTFENNGTSPGGLALVINNGERVPDLAIDGYVNPELPQDTTFADVRDCFDANVKADGSDATFTNFDAQADFSPEPPTDCSDTWTDFCHYQCTRDPLPTVTLQ